MTKCKLDECEFHAESLGLCKRHYEQQRRGRPFTFGPKKPVGIQVPWLLQHVSHEEKDACLTWPFSRFRTGVGLITWEKTNQPASRVMCELAHGAPPTRRHEAAHSCGKGHEACVNPNHLSWKTRKENDADKDTHGTRIKGEGIWRAVLTEQKVRDIREMAEVLPISLIASEFGLLPGHVSRVVSRHLWKHVA